MEPIAIVGVSAILPDAPDATSFWDNLTTGRYSISDVSPHRWDPALYYDADPKAPDKTYSTIGGWVRHWEWDPLAWKLPIPPKVSDAMDDGQKWAVACTRAALADYGDSFDRERTAVILGNAMAGEHHYLTALRIAVPEIARELESAPSFQTLAPEVRAAIVDELGIRMGLTYPEITEDTMPGELGNVMAGRVANLFDLHGPNFIVDAACASAMAAIDASIEGLTTREFDTVITGGVDRNMGASSFVKFCKIGALSATGTRPFDAGADGFVMGEGAALFVLKRLSDAERDGNRVYAVLRGIAGSSDGRGKGITAPNPVGQHFAIERAWASAGLSPAACSMLEAHGTSTRVGDVVEATALGEILAAAGLTPGSVALGSVKSNIGHLKAAAGAAGVLKTALALHHRLIPPSLNFVEPNPNLDWAGSPLRVNTQLREWEVPAGSVRTAGVSAFGFGGTNFHVVLEEHVPGRFRAHEPKLVAVGADLGHPSDLVTVAEPHAGTASPTPKAPLRGAMVLGAESESALVERLRTVHAEAVAGHAPPTEAPLVGDLRAPERIAIDFGDAAELADKAGKALAAFDRPASWPLLRGRGIFRGSGPAAPVAFMYTGQGSQYVNMLSGLRDVEPMIAERFAAADRVMTPLLGRPLSELIFVDGDDADAVAAADAELRNTEITQPAVLTVDLALTRLLDAYGIEPDMVIGHSLGEYGALVAAGALDFDAALEAVSARGQEMAHLSMDDNGLMAAVFAPLDEVQQLVAGIDGNVVLANVNSTSQSVIGGATAAVTAAVAACDARGWLTAMLPVSHAFHTSIVAPASEPLRRTLARLGVRSPVRPIVSNVTGEMYPSGPAVEEQMLDLLAEQVASPVQFVHGLRTLFEAGARVFVEVGPKRALHGFADDVLGADVSALFTNHPKQSDVAAFNQALCGLYAAGHGAGREPVVTASAVTASAVTASAVTTGMTTPIPVAHPLAIHASAATAAGEEPPVTTELGALFADFLDKTRSLVTHGDRPSRDTAPVVITGAALATPGTEKLFDDENLARILHGEQFIDVIPSRIRAEIVDKHIVRLSKSDSGNASFEAIDSTADVIKLAARAGSFDLATEFGVEPERVVALGRTTQLAIGAGLDALRDAGVPLVQRYKTTHIGTQLPERWGLADGVRDDTGIVFASAFPGLEEMTDEVSRFERDAARRVELDELSAVRARVAEADPANAALAEIDRRIGDVQRVLEQHPYEFDRRFLFRVLSMGHSQFAELIGARGPNTQVNSACASTTQAIAVAEDWIRAGRCTRVVIVAADDATSDQLLGWLGAGFLATGAAATDDDVTTAALPFDKRRHGMILGMGAAAIVVESAAAARERGVQPICEVLGAVTANSAFHGTRLDVDHIGGVMENVVRQAEMHGVRREDIASETVFVSHETYTPARGGSASAEIHALRQVFGTAADRIVIANTKGVTGHPMGVGLEDVVAIKALETGIVPPVANFKEVDPELGALNLSHGGAYPVRFALRLAAGFGSQISMVLLRWTPMPDGLRRAPHELGYASRVVDQAAWNRWLVATSGRPAPELEVVQRRLRVVDTGPVGSPQVASTVMEDVVAPAGVPAVAPQPAAVAPVPAPTAPAAPVPQHTAAHRHRLQRRRQRRESGVIRSRPASSNSSPHRPATHPRCSTWTSTSKPTSASTPSNKPSSSPQSARPTTSPATTNSNSATTPPSNTSSASSATAPHTPHQHHPHRPHRPHQPQHRNRQQRHQHQRRESGVIRSRPASSNSSPHRPATHPRCSTWTSTSKPTSASTPSNKPSSSPQSARPTTSPATTNSNSATTPPSNTSSASSATAPHTPHQQHQPQRQHQPATPETAATAPASGVGGDPVAARILELVAAQTGYPPEMLDLDLDLEADLGIDTVKQAELFASVREAYDIARDDQLKLRDYPTLQHVIGFVRDRAPHAPPAPPAPAPAATPAPAAARHQRRESRVIRPRRHRRTSEGSRGECPSRSSGRRCHCAGRLVWTSVPVPRVVVCRDAGGVADELRTLLAARGVEVLMIDGTPSRDDLEAQLRSWREVGPLTGVFWLAALDQVDVAALDPDSWVDALRRRVKLLATTMRVLYDDLTAGRFLVSAVRLGGHFGYDAAGAQDALGGATSGFTKALARERADALVKVIDVSSSAAAADVAAALLAETAHDPAVTEVGYANGLRWSVGLAEVDIEPDPARALDQDDVFVVTGAAGSIVSAITADLAAASHGTFHLLDLTPEPDPDDPDLERFKDDHDGLKTDLAQRIAERGERATPALVERELARLERSRAALDAIRAVRDAGGTVHWYQADLTDAAAVRASVQAIVERSGKVDVLLHCAGLEISRFLPDKTDREYDLVFDVKANGWFHLMHTLGDTPLGAAVVFSSIAGRFGNGGQTDYSAANDLLCKSVSALSAARPGTRGVAIDWTAWAGIGMASRGSIPKMMAMAGIDMLPASIGVPVVRNELTAAGGGGEVVVAGALGLMLDEPADGGIQTSLATEAFSGRWPMLGTVERCTVAEGLVVATSLTADQPFLDHHRIDGTPVLPGVMGIEAFAEAAAALVPGWQVAAVRDVAFLAPFKLYRDGPRSIEVRARLRLSDESIVADCVLLGRRMLPGQPEQVTTHFSASVELLPPDTARSTPRAMKVPRRAATAVGSDDVYRIYFHGPTYQVLASAWTDADRVIGALAADLPPNHQPRELTLFAHPRLVELCFQTAGVHQLGTTGAMALPARVERLELMLDGAGRSDDRGVAHALVSSTADGRSDAIVVDGEGRTVLRLQGYSTVELPSATDDDLLAPLQVAMRAPAARSRPKKGKQ